MITLETFPLRDAKGWIQTLTLPSGSEIIQVDVVEDQPVLHVLVYRTTPGFLTFLEKDKQDTYDFRIVVATTGENVGERLMTPMAHRGMVHWQGHPYLVWTD